MRTIIALYLALAVSLQAGRTFTAASSMYIEANTPVTAHPMSLSCWFRTNQVTSAQALVMITFGGANNQANWLYIAAQVAGDPLEAGGWDGITVARARSSASITTGTWYHAGGVFTSFSSRDGYLNGVKASDTTTITNAWAYNKVLLGRWDSSTDRFDGDMAEVGVWNVALTDAEMEALAAGLSPLRVRPSALVFYLPLWSSAFDYVGAKTLTDTTTTVADHPRIYR